MPIVEKKVCSVCKEEFKIKDGFYLNPATKARMDTCKKCTNNQTDNQMAAVQFCREKNIYFDLNLYQRAIVAAEKDNSKLYFGYYLKLLNMNKGTHGSKTFKDSLFDLRLEDIAFHETKTFDVRKRNHHCRVCQEDKPASEFFSSASPLDTSGLSSVCKKCTKEVFANFYQEHGELHCAIYETCAILDYSYEPKVVNKLINELNEIVPDKNGDQAVISDNKQITIIVDTEDVYGRYLRLCGETFESNRASRFDFYKERPAGYEDYKSSLSIEDQIAAKTAEREASLSRKWGQSYDEKDMIELEYLYSEWDQIKDLNEPSVSLLIRQLCMHQLDIEKKRRDRSGLNKKDYDVLALLMDKAGTTPNKVKGDDVKSQETWGTFIQTIEKVSPAEYLDKRKDKYFDVNNIEQYINALFVRPLRNFINGSRDFSVMIDDVSIQGIETDNGDFINGKN